VETILIIVVKNIALVVDLGVLQSLDSQDGEIDINHLKEIKDFIDKKINTKIINIFV
jgi:hypothetical protein